MASVTPCPACGLPSPASEIRCPRCFALKLKGGCAGSCSACRTSCTVETPPRGGMTQKRSER